MTSLIIREIQEALYILSSVKFLPIQEISFQNTVNLSVTNMKLCIGLDFHNFLSNMCSLSFLSVLPNLYARPKLLTICNEIIR